MTSRLRMNSAGVITSGPSSKFRNDRTATNGLTFASKMESRRHDELRLLERSGEIRNLRLQVRFELVPPVRLKGATRLTPGIDYVADFVYEERKPRTLNHGSLKVTEWVEVIEDCKGAQTAVYKMKRHMMKALLGLDIFESKPRA